MESVDIANTSSLREKYLSGLIQAKNEGTKIIGMYCTYCPRELIMAAGAIAVGLCGTTETAIPAAEKDLPRNLCPMVKSSYGLAVTCKCPYFALSDMVIGETTCDGKKKMFEVLTRQNIKDIYIMHLPQMPDRDTALSLWRSELQRLKGHLEKQLNVRITDDKIREAIRVTNDGQRALKELFDLNRQAPALVSGMDMLHFTFQLGFHPDRREAARLIRAVVRDIREKAASGYSEGNKTTKRILLTGTPVGIGSEKVIKLVEESGALVAAMENCGGYKTVDILGDESDTGDPLTLLAQKYLRIPCSVMSPNTGRIELLRDMIEKFHIDGVIDLTWQACHTYNVESYFVAKEVQEVMKLPFLQLETDYSQSDVETLRVRIEAFLEMVN
jgi:benzoyl-CoA reductase/2-hydroxyglutaryl-CoA dehydratase subunit BcrC/BadD/HgdB